MIVYPWALITNLQFMGSMFPRNGPCIFNVKEMQFLPEYITGIYILFWTRPAAPYILGLIWSLPCLPPPESFFEIYQSSKPFSSS